MLWTIFRHSIGLVAGRADDLVHYGRHSARFAVHSNHRRRAPGSSRSKTYVMNRVLPSI